MQIINLPVKDIFSDSTFNCRGAIAPIDVAGLAKDIDKHGLQQPIIVRNSIESSKSYTIISGHRRFKAFQILKREEIPCVINDEISTAQALILNLGENLQRADLNILQEAKALERLKMEGFSTAEVSEEIGRSSFWVDVRYKLLELPDMIQKAAVAGFINQNQIRELHKIDDFTKQIEIVKKIKKAKASGEKAPVINPRPSKRKILKAKARDTQDIEWMQNHIQENIGNNFGTRCLAWAAGYINDHEVFKDIKDISIQENKPYHIPYELGERII